MFGPVMWRFGGRMDPLHEMQRLQREMSRVFSGLEQPLNPEVPPVNAWVGESDIVVTAELPGVDPEKMDVSVVGDTLTISGAREAAAGEAVSYSIKPLPKQLGQKYKGQFPQVSQAILALDPESAARSLQAGQPVPGDRERPDPGRTPRGSGSAH